MLTTNNSRNTCAAPGRLTPWTTTTRSSSSCRILSPRPRLDRDDHVPIVTFADLPEPNEVTYAEGRLTTRTYASKSFTAAFGQDQGHPSRYIYRVFDEVVTDADDEWDWTNEVVFTTPGGRNSFSCK